MIFFLKDLKRDVIALAKKYGLKVQKLQNRFEFHLTFFFSIFFFLHYYSYFDVPKIIISQLFFEIQENLEITFEFGLIYFPQFIH